MTESEHTYPNYDVSNFFLLANFRHFANCFLEKEYSLIKQFFFGNKEFYFSVAIYYRVINIFLLSYNLNIAKFG